MIEVANLNEFGVKGSVQQKLRWVENGVDRCVWAGTVALGVLCHFTSPSSCFYHISISGQYCPSYR